MKQAIFLLLAASAVAQTATMTLSGPSTAKAGQTISLSLSASGTTNTGAAGFQWAIALPANYTATVSAGAAATTAVKTPSCTTDGSFCILVGQNATIIPNGVIASISLKVPASAPASPQAFPLSSLVGVDAGGINVATTSGAAYSLTITDKRDLNGNGTVDATDVQLMVNEVIAARTSPGACVDDLNGDGRCDLLDVFQVLLKSLGLIP